MPNQNVDNNVVRMSSLSKAFVRCQVFAEEAGLPVDPSALPVRMAFPVEPEEPISGDWAAAAWEVDPTGPLPVYYARRLVGPGSATVLTNGSYGIWVEVTSGTELVVEKGGVLLIT
jgi:hypothetical protein